jgi:hypothetical protein
MLKKLLKLWNDNGMGLSKVIANGFIVIDNILG